MFCFHCGKCCEETEMLLSEVDIELLEKAGHSRKGFARFDGLGFAQLQNCNGYCVFYVREKRRCKVYELRPLGCRIYPVIYSEEEGVVVDDLCPMNKTVSEAEIRRKGKKLCRLLKTIDAEAEKRRPHT
jgi:hypothetical protein